MKKKGQFSKLCRPNRFLNSPFPALCCSEHHPRPCLSKCQTGFSTEWFVPTVDFASLKLDKRFKKCNVEFEVVLEPYHAPKDGTFWQLKKPFLSPFLFWEESVFTKNFITDFLSPPHLSSGFTSSSIFRYQKERAAEDRMKSPPNS